MPKTVKSADQDSGRAKLSSRILGIFARIANVFMWISAVVMALSAVACAVILPHIQIDPTAKTVRIWESEPFSYEIVEDEFSIGDSTYGGQSLNIHLSEYDKKTIYDLIEKGAMPFLWGIVAMLAGGTILVALFAIVLGHAAKILKNVADSATPFTKTNIEYLAKIFKVLCAILIVDLIFNFCFMLIFGLTTLSVNLVSLGSILGVYVLLYVFRQGYALEQGKNA